MAAPRGDVFVGVTRLTRGRRQYQCSLPRQSEWPKAMILSGRGRVIRWHGGGAPCLRPLTCRGLSSAVKKRYRRVIAAATDDGDAAHSMTAEHVNHHQRPAYYS